MLFENALDGEAHVTGVLDALDNARVAQALQHAPVGQTVAQCAHVVAIVRLNQGS